VTPTIGRGAHTNPSLAAELSPAGVRAGCIRADGMPKTRTIQETYARGQARRDGSAAAAAGASTAPPLRPTVADMAALAAFLASDDAAGMTGIVEVRGGARR
jgi:NAD(P)-dependent dehydrogenase (short-subunit alcohol dehydrogenase family)